MQARSLGYLPVADRVALLVVSVGEPNQRQDNPQVATRPRLSHHCFDEFMGNARVPVLDLWVALILG
jgi:hypothetical protein